MVAHFYGLFFHLWIIGQPHKKITIFKIRLLAQVSRCFSENPSNSATIDAKFVLLLNAALLLEYGGNRPPDESD
jgi:hypothetical protein